MQNSFVKMLRVDNLFAILANLKPWSQYPHLRRRQIVKGSRDVQEQIFEIVDPFESLQCLCFEKAV